MDELNEIRGNNRNILRQKIESMQELFTHISPAELEHMYQIMYELSDMCVYKAKNGKIKSITYPYSVFPNNPNFYESAEINKMSIPLFRTTLQNL